MFVRAASEINDIVAERNSSNQAATEVSPVLAKQRIKINMRMFLGITNKNINRSTQSFSAEQVDKKRLELGSTPCLSIWYSNSRDNWRLLWCAHIIFWSMSGRWWFILSFARVLWWFHLLLSEHFCCWIRLFYHSLGKIWFSNISDRLFPWKNLKL